MWKHSRSDSGFSMMEVLAAIFILAILAAIAVPIFLNQQKQAHMNAVKSDISHTLTSLSMQKLDGKFPVSPSDPRGADPTVPVVSDLVLSDGVTVNIHTSVDRLSTCVDGFHSVEPETVFSISSVDKVVKEQAC